MSKIVIFCIFAMSSMAGAQVVCDQGVTYKEVVQLTTPDNKKVRLVLNGVGVKKVLFVDVFSSGLYLQNLSSNAIQIINSREVKVGVIFALRNISKDQLVEMWEKEYRRLCGGECSRLQDYHKQFLSYARGLRKKQSLSLLFFKDRIELELDGSPVGAAVKSPAYAKLLLRVFIGPDAKDKELEAGLLGKKLICKKS